MYKAIARSHLDYCDIIYHMPSVQSQLDYCDIIYHMPSVQSQLGVTLTDLMEKAEIIQCQTAFAVTGACQVLSRSKLYEELGWESLSERRWCRRIL